MMPLAGYYADVATYAFFAITLSPLIYFRFAAVTPFIADAITRHITAISILISILPITPLRRRHFTL